MKKLKCSLFLSACALTSVSHGSPILHWTLDETSGNTAADSSGNGFDGGYVIAGTPGWTAGGPSGNGYATFGGADQAFRTTSFPTISPGSFTPFSMSLWINPANTGNNTAAVLRTGVNNMYYSLKTQSGSVRQIARNTGEIQNSGGAVAIGDWHHVVAVYHSEDSREIYVNGVSTGTNTTNVPFLAPSGFSIGALDRSNSSVVDEFEGGIDDVQLYDQAVSAADVTFLFENAGSSLVPEPSTGLLAFLALGAGLVRRRR